MADLTYDQGHIPSNTGLKTWIFWLFVLLVGIGVLAASFLLSPLFPQLINWVMYLIIGGLGVSLIFKGYFDARFIQHQMDMATSQIGLLERVETMEEFLKASAPSLFRSHIENLYIISQAHTEISQDNLIELLHSKLLAKNKVVELFASILITLGLIGTILGLIIMMENLKSVMGGSQGIDDTLVQQLFSDAGPLAGLGVAFVTTLLGAMIGGVLIRVLTSVIEANIMNYTANVAELTEVYVLPHLRSIAQSSGNDVPGQG